MANPFNYPEIECYCDECKSYCKDPCWPTVEEAKAIMESIGPNSLKRYGTGVINNNSKMIYILTPRKKGNFLSVGECGFLTSEKLCTLHDLGLKPLEGKVVSHEYHPEEIGTLIIHLWNSNEGRELVRDWGILMFKPQQTL